MDRRTPGFGARLGKAAALILSLGLSTSAALAAPSHGIAMYGKPALPPDFVSLPYANPDAPQGGDLVMGVSGSFDSLNPFILKGNAATGIAVHTVETLMSRSLDEPFTLYGLLAESVETAPDRSWVEFTLRPEARFSDGSPVTVADVLWSFETIGTLGHPRYQTAWKKVAKAEQTGPRTLRITFNTPDRELPLLMGLRPVLKKGQWDGKAFDDPTMMVPVGSGPYLIADVKQGKSITYRKNPDYWGQKLAVNRGQNNFASIRYDYYGAQNVLFQAFTSGSIDVYREDNAGKWQTAYDFPALSTGEVVKEEIPHQRPSGMTGLVMNTRNPLFADWRVRDGMIEAFNFAFVDKTLNGGVEPQITSYFANSSLAAGPGPATGGVAELLHPFAKDLVPGTLEGWAPPPGTADKATDRASLRRAMARFEEAGWTIQEGEMKDAAGRPFTFEIVLQNGASDAKAVTDIYVEALKKIGVTPTVRTVDQVEMTDRQNRYAFDMTWFTRALTLSPGNEQTLYWGSKGVTEPGSRNLMGMNSPAAEAMIATMVNAPDQASFTDAARALDRILTAGRYVVPIWYSKVARIAHSRHLHHPDRLPLYGDWPGFMPGVWWYEN